MKKVLLTTDFSENARTAIQYGLQLFGSEDVSYTLLNTFREPGTSTAAMVSIVEYLQKESKVLLEQTVNDLKTDYPNHKITPLSMHGSLYPVINALAKRGDADLVVVGTRGASQVQNFFLGSNTMDVMRNCELPTVIVPKDYQYSPVHSIALALDYKPLETANILEPIMHVADLKDANVKAFHIEQNAMEVLTETPTMVKQLQDSYSRFDTECDTVKNDNVAAGIGSYMEDSKSDVLAIVARKHNFIERLFQKSITKEVGLLASFPMFVVRE